MPQFDDESVARFEEVLRRDPTSQVFAPLAEAYRQSGRLAEAERLALRGIQKHPDFAGGWIAWGKVLRDLQRPAEALEAFQKASHRSPENLLALQLLGEAHLQMKDGKEALRTFKRLLFLNPLSEKARRLIEKLETLTADEFGDDTFAMTKLKPLEEKPAAAAPAKAAPAAAPGEVPKGLIRMLSLVDAFIVRHDFGRALQLLDETRTEFGEHGLITQRQMTLQRRRTSQLVHESEQPEEITPIASREESVRERKVKALEAVLQRIEDFRAASLPL